VVAPALFLPNGRYGAAATAIAATRDFSAWVDFGGDYRAVATSGGQGAIGCDISLKRDISRHARGPLGDAAFDR
jgi:hypothetical protein